MASDVVHFAEALKLDAPVLLGHSMGARIAIRASNMKPAAFSRLVLVDPPVSGPGRRPYPSKLPWYVDSIRLSLKGIDAEGMKAFCPTWTDEQLKLRAEWLHTSTSRRSSPRSRIPQGRHLPRPAKAFGSCDADGGDTRRRD